MDAVDNLSPAEQLVVQEMRHEAANLDNEQQQAFFQWISGQVMDPPDAVRRVVTNLSQKINMAMGYLTTINLSRMTRISDFMEAAEQELFSVGRVESMDNEQLLELYGQAQKILSTSMDFSRKFLFQNKDMLDMSEVDEIRTLLGNLPPDRLKDLRKFLEQGMDADIKGE